MLKLLILAIAVLALVGLTYGAFCSFKLIRFRKHPRKLKTDNFKRRWKDLQKLLAHQESWNDAIIKADKLLDEALKKHHFKGKKMGERMVSAQKSFTDIDGVWFGHKLANRLKAEEAPKLKERDVKDALLGIGQALKDVGALK